MLKEAWLRLKIVLFLCFIMVGVHVVNVSMAYQLNYFGVQPGNVNTWWHIYTAPFLHGSYSHLINNLLGFLIFSWLCVVRSVSLYLWSSFFIITLSGILVWVFGRPAMHVGASGWIFGLWSLSIAIAWFDRSLLNILIALFVLFTYGGMIYGVFPVDKYVSFEYHLFGAIAGVVSAWLTKFFSSPKAS